MIETLPFPHIIVDNFLEKTTFERLKSEFPGEEYVKRSGRMSSKNRFNLMRDSQLQKKLIEHSKPWKEFDEYMKNDFILEMVQKFKPFIKQYKGILNVEKLSCGYDISRAGSGYKRSCHLDRRHHLIAFLLYFNDMEDYGGTGGELVLYESDKREVWDKFPSKDSIREFKKIQPVENRLVAFLNVFNSYHGITTMCDNTSDRLFLYASIDDKSMETVWPEEKVKVLKEERRLEFIKE